jgi:hypothetical protein
VQLHLNKLHVQVLLLLLLLLLLAAAMQQGTAPGGGGGGAGLRAHPPDAAWAMRHEISIWLVTLLREPCLAGSNPGG